MFLCEKVNRLLKFQLYLIKSRYPSSAFVIFICIFLLKLLFAAITLVCAHFLGDFFFINWDKHSNFWLKPAARFIYILIEYVQKGALLGRGQVSFFFNIFLLFCAHPDYLQPIDWWRCMTELIFNFIITFSIHWFVGWARSIYTLIKIDLFRGIGFGCLCCTKPQLILSQTNFFSELRINFFLLILLQFCRCTFFCFTPLLRRDWSLTRLFYFCKVVCTILHD